MNELHVFLTGAILVQYLVIAMFFYRFRQKTHDRFFGLFSYAFLLFGIERVIGFKSGPHGELFPYVYCFRLAGFSLIIIGFILKNRETPSITKRSS